MAGKRGRPKIRPLGWSPSFVLRWLESHPGANLFPDLLERLCREMRVQGKHVHAQTLYQEISRWKKKDPEFKSEYERLSEGRHPAVGNTGGAALAMEFREGCEDWKVDVVLAYLRTGSRAQAAGFVGISYSQLSNKLSKPSPDYDEELDDLWRQAEAILLDGKEGLIEWALEEAKAQGDAKTVLNGALAVLERLNKEKWSKREERKVTGTIEHKHIIEDRRQKAMEEAARTSRALFGPERKALEAPTEREEVEIVEVEYAEVPSASTG